MASKIRNIVLAIYLAFGTVAWAGAVDATFRILNATTFNVSGVSSLHNTAVTGTFSVSGVTTLTGGLNTPLTVPNGGTALGTLTAHGILLGNGTGTPNFVGPCSTTTLVHGQGAADPSCAQVNLAADVTGTLPVGNGGTGTTTGPPHGQQLFTSNGTFTVPSNVYFVQFECWGPGGGGGGYGAGNSNGGNGSANTTVKISSTTYCQGSLGTGGSGTAASTVGLGGTGGVGTSGTLNLTGQNGFSGNVQGGTGLGALGGQGGAAPRGDVNSTTGIGCGGDGGGDGAGAKGAGGGGAGGYSEKVVSTTPTTAFAITVGTGGAAGTGGTANGVAACATGGVLATW